MDLIVQKATELGVDAVQPFFAARSVPRLVQSKYPDRQQHWQQIAINAVKQSGSRTPPDILLPCSFAQMLGNDYGVSTRIICWEQQSRPLLRDLLVDDAARHCALVVGPEGGFSGQEIDRAVQAGMQACGLGSAVLRAETAALAGLTIIGFCRGTLG